MARVYADANGVILLVTQTAAEDTVDGAAVSAVFTVDFDASTNGTLLTNLIQNQGQFSVPGGVLTQSGQAVTIAAASNDYATIQFVKQAISVFKGTETLPSNAVIQNAFTAVQGGTATLLQTQIVAAVLARALGLMAQRLINNGTLG